jgi:vacuolar-type H+-ATPase subunit H
LVTPGSIKAEISCLLEITEIINNLRYMLEDVENRSHQWIEAAGKGLSELAGDELARRQKEIGDVTKEFNRIQEKIQQNIDTRLQSSTTDSGSG